MTPGRRGRRQANARPSHCVGEKIASSAGLLIQPKEGTRKKPAAFAKKLRTYSQKRPTFARELRGFCPPALRRTTKQRKHRTSTGGRAPPNAGRAARSPGRNEPLRRSSLRATRRWADAGRRDPRRSALPHSKAGKGAEALRSTGGNSRCGSATRGAVRICVPTLGDSQGAWSRETRRCHTGAHALSRRRTRRLS